VTRWVEWARTLVAVAQNGLEYAENAYDEARYRDVRRVAAEMLATGGAGEPPVVVEVLERDRGYATPKVDVRGYVAEDGRVLLVKERADGLWTLPGGWADPGDLPSQAIEREVAEEAGYLVRARRLLACWDRSRQVGAEPYPFRVYKLFFACEIVGDTARDPTEIEEVAWYPLAALPPLSLGRVTAGQLARLDVLARDPAAPAAFD
jgi:ADP-ribose pyrophosphatase YjhB (NUDIX family)